MSLNKRERVLVYLLIVVIGIYLFYTFIHKTNVTHIESLKNEVNQKNIQAELLLGSIEKEKKLSIDFKTLNFEIGDLSLPYLDNIQQENAIVFFNQYFKDFNIEVNTVSFTPVSLRSIVYGKLVPQTMGDYPMQNLKNNYFSIVSPTPVEQTGSVNPATAETMTVSFDFMVDYYSLINFIDALQNNQVNFVINNLSLTAGEETLVNGNMDVSFYAIPKLHEQENMEWIWSDLIEFGRANPFYLDGVSLDPYWTSKYDLEMSIGPILSDTPTISIGQYTDSTYSSFIYGDSNTVEEVEISFKQEEEKFYFKYRTSLGSYPTNTDDWVEFIPTNEFLSMKVISQERVNAEDFSGVNLTIKNNTNRLFYINIFEDDLIRPRLNIITTDNVILKKN